MPKVHGYNVTEDFVSKYRLNNTASTAEDWRKHDEALAVVSDLIRALEATGELGIGYKEFENQVQMYTPNAEEVSPNPGEDVLLLKSILVAPSGRVLHKSTHHIFVSYVGPNND